MSYKKKARMMDKVKQRWNNIKKSPIDKCTYRGLLLSNNMKILLISDPTTEESAASIDVGVGYMSDPWEIPGLAHFCEHMLFLGTKKYPGKNDFMSFLSKHRGDCNADTADECTNFYFHIMPDHLEEGLDRFSQLFLTPLFTKSTVDLEIKAIDSEAADYKNDDTLRVDQIDRSSAISRHPYRKFRHGNAKTLGVSPKKHGLDVVKELLKFFNQWYSSSIMTLSVLGKETLDDLEKMVTKRFAKVPNKRIEAPRCTEHPFNDENFRTKLFIVPVQDIRYMRLIFPLPAGNHSGLYLALLYIHNLIGHEGSGSLLSVLKSIGWCCSLKPELCQTARGSINFLEIFFSLTTEGLNHIDEIIKLIFQYINMIKTAGPQEWIYNEFNEIININYNYPLKDQPRIAVTHISRQLQLFPVDEEVLYTPFVFNDWRPDLIEQIFEYLSPKLVRVHIVAQVFEDMADRSEFWYGTKYSEEKISEDIINWWSKPGWPDYLKLPKVNEFIPKNFHINVSESTETSRFPVVIHDSAILRVWFQQYDECQIPTIDITIDFTSPLTVMDPLNQNLTSMYIKLLEDSLSECSFSARRAGLKWSIVNTSCGFELSLDGYYDKHRVLLDKILDKMINFTIDEQRFKILKDNYMRSLMNFYADQPNDQANFYLGLLLSEKGWTHEELIAAMDYLTVEKLDGFVPQLLENLHLECLLIGSVTKNDALETTKLIELKLAEGKNKIISPLLPRQLEFQRHVSLKPGCKFLYEINNKFHELSCAVIYYQFGMQSIESNVHLWLLAQIISEPCFNTLRTEEQLGYGVSSGVYRKFNAQGFQIAVQSDKHPRFVEKRIEVFLDSMLEELTDMSNEDFSRHKSSLLAVYREKLVMLSHSVPEFWEEITTRQYNFDRVKLQATYLKTVTKQKIIQVFKKNLHGESQRRSKLAVHVVSTNQIDETKEEGEDAGNIKIKDIAVFKASQGLFPI